MRSDDVTTATVELDTVIESSKSVPETVQTSITTEEITKEQMTTEVMNFYKDFYGYDMLEEYAELVMCGKDVVE